MVKIIRKKIIFIMANFKLILFWFLILVLLFLVTYSLYMNNLECATYFDELGILKNVFDISILVNILNYLKLDTGIINQILLLAFICIVILAFIAYVFKFKFVF